MAPSTSSSPEDDKGARWGSGTGEDGCLVGGRPGAARGLPGWAPVAEPGLAPCDWVVPVACG
eukprot:9287671-Alexandrium_andersonii.AAC.1